MAIKDRGVTSDAMAQFVSTEARKTKNFSTKGNKTKHTTTTKNDYISMEGKKKKKTLTLIQNRSHAGTMEQGTCYKICRASTRSTIHSIS